MDRSYQMPAQLLLDSELAEAQAPRPNQGPPQKFGAACLGNEHLYFQVTVSAFSEDFRVIASIGPRKTDDAIRRLPRNERDEYVHTLADIRHKTAPRYFHALTDIIAQYADGAAPQEKLPDHSPYTPNGRWVYLPPVHPYDWRTRAECTVPKAPFELSKSLFGPCYGLSLKLLESLYRHKFLADVPAEGGTNLIDLTASVRPPRNGHFRRSHVRKMFNFQITVQNA